MLPVGHCLWKAIWVFIQHFPISGTIFRYRELEFPISGNQFPISGNDRFPDVGKWFSISGIDFPISGNVLDLPISGNQFPISENRHPTEAGHSATLQHRPTTPPPINNGPQLYRPHLLVETVITTSVNRSVQPTIIIQPMISLKNTQICGAELMSLMILTRTEHWDNYMYHYITICIFVKHFDMPFKNRDNNYDKTYHGKSTEVISIMV